MKPFIWSTLDCSPSLLVKFFSENVFHTFGVGPKDAAPQIFSQRKIYEIEKLIFRENSQLMQCFDTHLVCINLGLI
jgi:hypothetical protein